MSKRRITGRELLRIVRTRLEEIARIEPSRIAVIWRRYDPATDTSALLTRLR